MKAVIPSALFIGAVALLLLSVCALLGHAWYTDIDINSGAYRRQVCIFFLVVRTEVEESALSREVRRLGIDVPATQVWKRAFESRLVTRTHVDYSYGRVVFECNELLSFLDMADAPDEERRTVLKLLMASLQTGDPRQACGQARSLTNEMGEKLTKRLETLRKEQEAQTAVP